MKVVLFALDNIFDVEWNGKSCNELCGVYEKFSKMYIISRQESYTKSELKNFKIYSKLKLFKNYLNIDKLLITN